MRNVASVSSDESSILILCSLELPSMQFVLQCDQWFHDGLIFFFHYLLLLERTFEWALSPLPCLLFFALHLEWSLNLSTGKKSNAMVYLRSCVPLYLVICGSNFFQLGSTFCRNARKKRPKTNREKFKCR